MPAALGPIRVEPTRGPRDAERIAREGVLAFSLTLDSINFGSVPTPR
jgi:hypothetical protein